MTTDPTPDRVAEIRAKNAAYMRDWYRSRLTRKQTISLALIAELSSAQVIAGESTWADRWTAFIHFQTAEGLERRGLIAIADNDITLTDAGRKVAARS